MPCLLNFVSFLISSDLIASQLPLEIAHCIPHVLSGKTQHAMQLLTLKNAFCARLPSKSESGRCENEAFVRDFLFKFIHSIQFKSVQLKFKAIQFKWIQQFNSTQFNSIQFIQVNSFNSFNSFLHSYILGHHKCPQHGSSFKLPLIITPIYIYTHIWAFFPTNMFLS